MITVTAYDIRNGKRKVVTVYRTLIRSEAELAMRTFQDIGLGVEVTLEESES